MKNLNVKHYHQAYHPYNLPTNPHHQLQIQQHLQNIPYTPTTTAIPSQRFNNNCNNNLISYNSPATTSSVCTKLTTNSPVTQINNLPPTLGGYLANQQQQRVLQQQQQKNINQHLTQPQTQQQQINMLSLNQTNTYNYNFHFNAANSNNNNNNLSHNTNSKNHYNSALSHPQRPNSLNISAMASLATPGTFSTTNSVNSSCHSASTTTSGFNFNPNQYYNNHRENVFNFPINQQQQPQQQQQQQQHYNHNNFSHQQNYNNYNIHHNQQQHQQQQQQQLQQFQLLQQQLKQQQSNNLCDLTPSVSATTLAIPATITADKTNQSNNNNICTNGINNNNNNCDKLAMDASEIANFLANELFMQQLVSMECMQTGVPTLTTPTLTPTTLKSIEESFIQLTSEPINAPYQAGFIPPPLGSYNSITSTATNNNNNTINNNNNNSTLISTTTTVAGISPNTTLNNVYLGDISTGASLKDYSNLNESDTENSQESWIENQLNEDNSMATSDNSSGATDTTSFQNGLNGMGVNTLNNSNSSTTNDFSGVNLTAKAVATTAAKMSGCNNNNTSSSATTVTPRRGGGRRPATNSNMSPEEEEKRRIRRERNKLAAARCRKRRVDQTNELTDEVQLLEKRREELQKQIESLNGTKQNLEFILEAHRPTCQRLENTEMLSVNTFAALMPSSTTTTTANDNITGLDTSLATTARSVSPLDLKPVLNDHLLAQIKAEPLDVTLDSNSCLDQDGPTSPKRILLHNNNPMIPPPLPNVATLSASLAAASASLNTPIITTAPVSFASMYSNNPTLNVPLTKHNSKQRPNTLPTIPRNLAQNLALGINDNKPPTDINGVAIQTPSTGMFNFDSLMDGGTGLTPVSGPLVPNCSSQNKHPLELVTPTSEPSKLVSL